MIESTRPSQGRSQNPLAGRGFTLIELLVVIVIIGILVSVAVTVASKVTQGGRVKLSQDVIRVCDQTMTAAASALESKAPSKFVDAQGNEFPIVDGRPASAGAPFNQSAEPTSALYFLSVAKLPGLDEMFKGLDAKLVQRESAITTAFGAPDLTGTSALIVKDGFGRPVRYVNPTYHGGYGTYLASGGLDPSRGNKVVKYKVNNADQQVEMRRSYRPFGANGAGVGDADEGICTGGAAYFYSAGSDGDPGTRDDNVYTTKPTFPLETQKFGT